MSTVHGPRPSTAAPLATGSYADELRKIGAEGLASEVEIERARSLARVLVALHARSLVDEAGRYERAVRQIFCGPDGLLAACEALPVGRRPPYDPGRLSAVERRFIAWRWRLRERPERLRALHGAISVEALRLGPDGALSLTPPAVEQEGDPARDVASLALVYLVAGVAEPVSWAEGFRLLWDGVWSSYLGESGDHELLDVAPPFVAWRALLAASRLPASPARPLQQDRLFSFAEATLDVRSFDPDTAGRFVR